MPRQLDCYDDFDTITPEDRADYAPFDPYEAEYAIWLDGCNEVAMTAAQEAHRAKWEAECEARLLAATGVDDEPF